MGGGAVAQPSAEGFAAAVAGLELEAPVRAALIDRDAGRLGELLGGRPRMLCALLPAEDEERREDEGGEDEQKEEDSPAERPN
jgi:hypothetical protein